MRMSGFLTILTPLATNNNRESRFPSRCNRAMSAGMAGALSPAREGDLTVSTFSKPVGGAFPNENGKMSTHPSEAPPTDQPAATLKKKAVIARTKPVLSSKTGKVAQRPARSSRVASKAEKLVCRHCGSDDLAPSFKKRRDARCRACFKQRYGSSSRRKTASRARKAKAAK